MKISDIDSKFEVLSTKKFDKQLRKIVKQGKDIEKIISVVEKLANGMQLEYKYKDHQLINNKRFKECRECHIEPDWLLVYEIINEELIILLLTTGTHSDLF